MNKKHLDEYFLRGMHMAIRHMKKIFNITNHWDDVNQNQNEITFHLIKRNNVAGCQGVVNSWEDLGGREDIIKYIV